MTYISYDPRAFALAQERAISGYLRLPIRTELAARQTKWRKLRQLVLGPKY